MNSSQECGKVISLSYLENFYNRANSQPVSNKRPDIDHSYRVPRDRFFRDCRPFIGCNHCLYTIKICVEYRVYHLPFTIYRLPFTVYRLPFTIIQHTYILEIVLMIYGKDRRM